MTIKDLWRNQWRGDVRKYSTAVPDRLCSRHSLSAPGHGIQAVRGGRLKETLPKPWGSYSFAGMRGLPRRWESPPPLPPPKSFIVFWCRFSPERIVKVRFHCKTSTLGVVKNGISRDLWASYKRLVCILHKWRPRWKTGTTWFTWLIFLVTRLWECTYSRIVVWDKLPKVAWITVLDVPKR